MCSHYQAVKTRERYRQRFDVEPPSAPSKQEVWPGYVGSFVRRHPQGDAAHETLAQREAVSGLFGLVPHWATDTKITRHTYNARVETVAEKPSFRDAWKLGQHCIIPAQAIYEPDWRSGKAVPTRIEHADEEPMGIAGLWSSWKSDKGELVFSYTMLTINADQHPLMKQFHKPLDEKRMVVILRPDQYADWLEAPSKRSMEFMQLYPADLLMATAATPLNGALFE